MCLDIFFSTDYVLKVDGILIAVDISAKADSASLSKKEADLKCSMRFLRTIGIKKGLVISWNNPGEDSLFDILDAIESDEEVSTVIV